MSEIYSDNLRYMILSQVPGIGPVSQNRLLKMNGNIEKCFSVPVEDMLYADEQIDKTVRIGKKRLEQFAIFREDTQVIEESKMIFEKCAERGIKVITPACTEYPKRLKGIMDMPVVLYAKGNLDINSYSRSAGIVGARRCTQEGKQKAIRAAKEELMENAAVISGMAKGIDSYAHTAALKEGGYTIAVLGGGADICYPPEHKVLYDTICQKGCILSEYPPGVKPNRYMFASRNRLIAGLSDRLYVIDAGRISGTNTTVEDCTKYGREVVRL